jgi:2-succinyl-5-enolpyruvyl-6-hydroxy-3-cyclohexene-1-carboxylate synthase
MAASEGMRVHVAIDERSASFFALGSAKAGQLAVVVTTSGTAAANLYPAIVESDLASIPLLVITADRPPELRHTGANQTIDQVKMFGDRVRWYAEMGPGEDRPGESGSWRSMVCQAVATAIGSWGRRGPVHLNLGSREPLVPTSDDGRSRAAPYANDIEGRSGNEPWTAWEPPQDPPPLEVPVKGRVLVVLGDEGSPELARMAIDAGCVVIAEGHSGSRIPGTITTSHHLLASPLFADSARPDLVVQVGRVGLSRNLASFMSAAPDRLVVSRHAWADPERSARRWVRSVIFASGTVERGWSERWSEAEAKARRVLDAALDESSVPDEARTARDTAAAVPNGGTLVVGSSMPVRDLDLFMGARNGLRVVSNRGASGIDGFVSTALGAAVASPTPTVALAGDLTMLHDRNGWLIEPRPRLVTVVINNNGGGIFSFLPQASFPDRFEDLFGTPRGINFETMARDHGLSYQHIEVSEDLGPAIVGGIASSDSHLLEVRTDRAENVKRHRQLTELVVGELLER